MSNNVCLWKKISRIENNTDYNTSFYFGNWNWSVDNSLNYKKPRTINFWRQTEKYDPKGEYVKKWLPVFRC